MRGTGNTYITGSSASDTTARWTFSGSDISCEGNIETLLNYVTVESGLHPSMGRKCFDSLFCDCTNLITCPSLPARTLTNGCYSHMFAGCTNLTTLPKLPATSLPSSVYFYMFYNCKKIKLSTTQTGSYQIPYRIPASGTGSFSGTSTYTLREMFWCTGGSFGGSPTASGTPSLNTTYYTSNTVV